MVKLMLDGFGGDCRRTKPSVPDAFGIQCYHVNARFSKNLEDVGVFQGTKIFLIPFFCLQAIWIRFRHGVDNFYYVPAPGKRVALYRDWLVMLLCRPFFKHMILHWHAAGLAKWLETSVQIRARALTYQIFKPVDLSIVLSRYNVADAEKLLSRRIGVVSNGIPDPCPDFSNSVLPRRQTRLALRNQLLRCDKPEADGWPDTGESPLVIQVLFLAHCTREKGLFAAIEGVVAANRILAAQHSPLRIRLSAAGNFVTAAEKAEFDRLLKLPEYATTVRHLGFISAETKKRALREADVFCFPTCYFGENQPVNLLEAMAFGLPIVTTRWRSLPEMLPPDYPGLVPEPEPDKIAAALIRLALNETGENLREHFLAHFSLQSHLAKLAVALRSVENPAPASALLPAVQRF